MTLRSPPPKKKKGNTMPSPKPQKKLDIHGPPEKRLPSYPRGTTTSGPDGGWGVLHTKDWARLPSYTAAKVAETTPAVALTRALLLRGGRGVAAPRIFWRSRGPFGRPLLFLASPGAAGCPLISPAAPLCFWSLPAFAVEGQGGDPVRCTALLHVTPAEWGPAPGAAKL